MGPAQKREPQLTRRVNAARVFSLIQSEGPISRAELAKRTGIRSTSISGIVAYLASRKLVREVGRGPSTGGRQPTLLAVNPSGLYAAGLEIGENALNGVVVDLTGQVVASAEVPLPDVSVETVAQRGDALLARLSRESGRNRKTWGAVGVALPGILTRDKGVVVISGPLGWQNVPLKALLEDRWGVRVYLLNNAVAGALAAHYERGERAASCLLFVLVYLRRVRRPVLASFGCGIVLDGRPYRGAGELAGEVRADVEHPVAIASRREGVGAPRDLDELVAATRREPSQYAPVWRAFADQMGRVIAWGADFLNPGEVVIGSDLAELEELAGAAFREVVWARTIGGLVEELTEGELRARVPVRFFALARDTLARGAIVPQLREISLAPLIGETVLG